MHRKPAAGNGVGCWSVVVAGKDPARQRRRGYWPARVAVSLMRAGGSEAVVPIICFGCVVTDICRRTEGHPELMKACGERESTGRNGVSATEQHGSQG